MVVFSKAGKSLENRGFTRNAFLCAVLMLITSCAEQTPGTEIPPERIAESPNAGTGAAEMQDVLVPDPDGGNQHVDADDFVGGRYGTDIDVAPGSEGVDSETEESNARKSRVFQGGIGFVWKISPAQPVTVTLSNRLGEQRLQRSPGEDGIVAVSLSAFGEIYPPAFREVYRLTVSSLAGSVSPFAETYQFAAKVKQSATKLSRIESTVGAEALVLGKTDAQIELGRAIVDPSCDICSVGLYDVTVKATKKTFTELPAIPEATKFRISEPGRFKGLLVKLHNHALTYEVRPESEGKVAVLRVTVPRAITSVEPWCTLGPRGANNQAPCNVDLENSEDPRATYFGSLNAVPSHPEVNLLGGVSGVAWFRIVGKAELRVERDGVIIERRDVVFDSGDVTPLNDTSIPTWAADDMRSALFSGAPEFSF